MAAEPARILVVDDQQENLLALAAVLKSLDASVATARSGEDALRALMADHYAVILMDVLMPGMDGFETAYHIKRKDRTRDIPIIFLTAARGEPDLAFRGFAVGAVDYLVKPFDPWVLRSKVEALLDLHRERRRLDAGTSALAGLLPGLAGLPTDPSTASALVKALTSRLEAVEASVEAMSDTVTDTATKQALIQLDRETAALRAAHDALFTPPD
ncbi:response regulator [Actinomadura rupiterrae]|uniref:response regulator n=1 Tax=Actinomadura rupiterrae TaxID=559627 RepID=UPI0020A558C9|nr:response regulator [Actinomadura rupiterrae]MCP2340622.1 CheY-like chemotaxis protein [Actinomadura rupiterrae]